MELDHVLMAVADLEVAGRDLEIRHGLASIEGGRHPAWGTANRIVPLGDSYLELVAVVDAAIAAESAFGRWVAFGVSGRVQPLGWAVRTSRLGDVARRLDLTIQAGSRATPDGGLLRWRTAGLGHAIAEPSLPFFIQWEPGTSFPGQAAVHHRLGTARIAELVIGADPDRLAEWLGSHRLPIVIRSGTQGLTAIRITGQAGDTIFGATG